MHYHIQMRCSTCSCARSIPKQAFCHSHNLTRSFQYILQMVLIRQNLKVQCIRKLYTEQTDFFSFFSGIVIANSHQENSQQDNVCKVGIVQLDPK